MDPQDDVMMVRETVERPYDRRKCWGCRFLDYYRITYGGTKSGSPVTSGTSPQRAERPKPPPSGSRGWLRTSAFRQLPQHVSVQMMTSVERDKSTGDVVAAQPSFVLGHLLRRGVLVTRPHHQRQP